MTSIGVTRATLYLPCRVLIGDTLLDVAKVKLSRDGPVVEPTAGDDYVLLVEEGALNDDGINEAVSRVPKQFQKEVRESALITNNSTRSLKKNLTLCC